MYTVEDVDKAMDNFYQKYKKIPTVKEWSDKKIKPCAKTIEKIYGSWNKSLQKNFGKINKIYIRGTPRKKISCAVCNKLTKNKKFCSTKCVVRYYKDKIWVREIIDEIRKYGFLPKDEILSKVHKLFPNKPWTWSRISNILRNKEVFTLYNIYHEVMGIISKEFYSELQNKYQMFSVRKHANEMYIRYYLLSPYKNKFEEEWQLRRK